MRVCVVYDCIFPWTVGGAERWYRSLSERLAAAGHDVTYITLRQWDRNDQPQVPGMRVVAAGPRMALYTGGRRRILPPLVFGAGVLWHLLRAGKRYDTVHTASFPYFSLLAAALVRRLHRFSLVVDWHEFWTRSYWREYLGAVGRIGWWIQRLCVRTPQRAFCFARVTARRLSEEGLGGEITVLEGEYAGPLEPRPLQPAEPLVVFAGRHIPEKRVPALIPAFALARQRLGSLRCEIFGDGPDRPTVLRLIEEYRLGHAVRAPGFVPSEEVERALSRALCMVLPSRREGYGLIVVEASSYGTPSVVVDEEDNAAVELVTDGENGVVAASASPNDLAEAVLRVHEAGRALRESTATWFARNSLRLSLDSSLAAVLESYAAGLDGS